MILVIIENILHKINIYIYYLQYQIVLKRWRAKVECIHAARLVSIETDVTIRQEDANAKLLEGDGISFRDFVPLSGSTDTKKITHHRIALLYRDSCSPHRGIALPPGTIQLRSTREITVVTLDALHTKVES